MSPDTTDEAATDFRYQYDSSARAAILNPPCMPTYYPAMTYDAAPRPQPSESDSPLIVQAVPEP